MPSLVLVPTQILPAFQNTPEHSPQAPPPAILPKATVNTRPPDPPDALPAPLPPQPDTYTPQAPPGPICPHEFRREFRREFFSLGFL